MRSIGVYVLTGILALQTVGCGTLIYPERHGQKSGRIDPGIAILDAAGLLVFLVPGLIAFGVDFTTGAIYLPGGSAAVAEDEEIRVVAADPQDLSEAALDQLMADATAGSLHLDDARVQVLRVDSEAELLHQLRQF